jgi:hypothetical protein
MELPASRFARTSPQVIAAWHTGHEVFHRPAHVRALHRVDVVRFVTQVEVVVLGARVLRHVAAVIAGGGALPDLCAATTGVGPIKNQAPVGNSLGAARQLTEQSGLVRV